MATKTDRLGETRMMNCGMEATIIRYGSAMNIDVCFEDEKVVEHRTYDQFKKGIIVNPNIKASRLGETRMMNCGMETTIIRYRNAGDIDVRFEDGFVIKHKQYRAFKRGKIANPNFNSRLGKTRVMKCGMEATIIRYGNARDIDVRFKDGAVVEHKIYGDFKNGYIAHPNTKDRLGETRMMNCGMEATIIQYENAGDIDIRFEDGTVTKHKTYYTFKKGQIANPNIKASTEDRLGETRMMNCGMEATIIRYGGYNDIDVHFEDGAVVEHRQYRDFKKGGIAYPSATAEDRLGETRMMNCGMKAAIIRYGSAVDIDVRFEDGKVVVHKKYDHFKRGNIANPNTKVSAKDRLGETRMMYCSMEATIIRYNTGKDIDVRFEDGTVVEHRRYDQFKKGEITNPDFNPRLNETRMMSCGMKATIIRYGRCDDIDVRFEDEKVVEHRAYDAFKKGKIANPSISQRRGSKDFHGFICRQGFIDEDRTLYECICKHCGLEDVLTPQEMMEHEKIEHGKDK